MRASRALSIVLALLTREMPARAAAAPLVAGDARESTVDERAQRWHRELEHEGDYNESWFLMVQTDSGGLLVVTLFVSNLGLRTFDGGYDFSYYALDGTTVSGHQEVRREAIAEEEPGRLLRIGPARVGARDGGWRVEIGEPALGLDVALAPELPAYEPGSGRVAVDGGKAWTQGMQVPRARVSGSLRSDSRRIALAGRGYLDHSWSTVKLPSLLASFRTLRVLGSDVTLVLFDQRLAARYGGRPARFGLLAVGGTIVGPLRDVRYATVETRRDEASGHDVPVALELEASAGDWRVRGTVRESRFLESVDVLGRLSWPVRTVIGALYSRPYTLRYFGRYELDLTSPAGVTAHASGEAPLEANFY